MLCGLRFESSFKSIDHIGLKYRSYCRPSAFSSDLWALSAEQAVKPKQSMDNEMRYIGFIRDSLVGHLINALIPQKQISAFTAFQERKKGVRFAPFLLHRSFHETFISPRLVLLAFHGLSRAFRYRHRCAKPSQVKPMRGRQRRLR